MPTAETRTPTPDAVDRGHAYRELQLRVLRSLVWIILAVIVAWTLTINEDEPLVVLTMRVLIVLYLGLIQLRANDRTAAVHGIGIILALKTVMSMRTLTLPAGETDAFSDLVILGPNRVLPILSALFGGVSYCLAMTAWCVAELLGVFVVRHGWAAAAPGASASDSASASTAAGEPGASLWLARSKDTALLFVELYYITMAATCGIALVHYYRRALGDLGDALQARQRFITNMVLRRPEALVACQRGLTMYVHTVVCIMSVGLCVCASLSLCVCVYVPRCVTALWGVRAQNHELRTPLVGVLSMADVMLHEQRESLTAASREYLQVIIDSMPKRPTGQSVRRVKECVCVCVRERGQKTQREREKEKRTHAWGSIL
jgi:hypothetical protein